MGVGRGFLECGLLTDLIQFLEGTYQPVDFGAPVLFSEWCERQRARNPGFEVFGPCGKEN